MSLSSINVNRRISCQLVVSHLPATTQLSFFLFFSVFLPDLTGATDNYDDCEYLEYMKQRVS